MRLAILSSKKLESDKDILLEYKEPEVKAMLKELLETNDFDKAWDIIVKKLKDKTRYI